jgi:tRNA A58 N-methylase Trm61
MIPPRPTSLAWTILRDSIREGDTVIDATAGNGHDTVFLAECVGATGRVLAFDIQERAIWSARLKVDQAGFAPRVEFHRCTHARMAEHAAAGSVSAVMFNLGYLPGENHETTTLTSETLPGLEAAVEVLKSGGVLSVVCYPGHQAGADEAVAVETWFKSQTEQGWRVAKYQMLGTLKPAPFLVLGGKP